MHYSYYKRPLFLLLLLYIAALCFFYKPSPSKKDVFHKIPEKNVTLEGTVISFPIVRKDHYNAFVKVHRVNGQKTGGKIYARFKTFEPRWRDTVRIEGSLKKPYSIAMFGNFDWGAYLASKNVFTEINAASVERVAPPGWPVRFISGLRASILKSFERNFDSNLAGIAGGILLGERGEIDPELFTSFQDSGAIHLLVASGGNVGFVTLMVFAFCALFSLKRKQTALIALAIAGVYTIIAGADAPLTRAYFMTVCAVLGYVLNRNSGVFQGLVLSCFVILVLTPSAVFETGFQMSFLATLAIVVCLNNYTLPYAWPNWAKFFMQIFLATLSTQLILLPIFTNIFFKVSLTGLAANMLLVPLASFIMGLSFAFYLFDVIGLGFVLKGLTWLSLFVFKMLVQFFAGFKISALPASAWSAGVIIAFYAAFFLAAHFPHRAFFKKILWPGVAIMVLTPLIQFILFNPVKVYLLSEWNKSVVLVRTPGGKVFLSGAAVDGEKLAKAVLKSGSSKVAAVFITENNKTETKGLAALREILVVERVIYPFEEYWPGDSFSVRGIPVGVEWGFLLNRNGGLWRNQGYSGAGRDSVSYTLTLKDKPLTISGSNRFVLYDGNVTENKRNETVLLKI